MLTCTAVTRVDDTYVALLLASLTSKGAFVGVRFAVRSAHSSKIGSTHVVATASGIPIFVQLANLIGWAFDILTRICK